MLKNFIPALLLSVFSLNALAEANRQGIEKTGVTGGVAIDFSLSPVEAGSGIESGNQAIVTIKLKDARTGKALANLRPRAWFSARLSEMVASETSCPDKVKSLVGGNLSARADVDLNSYWLLTLNHDNTVSFINPQVSFGATQLESIVALPGKGADWVQSPDKKFVYISVPEHSAVAVIDIAARKLLTTISTGSNTKPTRLMMQSDGHYLWVGLNDSSAVAVIGIATNKLVSTVETGNGLHSLVFTGDRRFVYVSNSRDDSVTAIDTNTLTKAADIKVGKTPVAVAYGNASELIYVAALNGESITAIDPQTQKVTANIQIQKGIVALGFEPNGRFIFAVNQLENTVSVLDTANNKIIGITEVIKEPDQIIFTDSYAYIRGLGSEKFSLIDLDGTREGNLQPVEIQAGRLAPEQEANQIGVAPMMVATPDGNSVMIANAPDRVTYFYQEGMMAPMGTLSNYKRIPLGVMIIDQSLTESAPGIYTTFVRLPHAGRFDVPVVLDQPRIIHCFQVTVAEDPSQQKAEYKATVKIDRVADNMPVIARKPHNFRFRITDPLKHLVVTGLRGAGILAVRAPGTWQRRDSLKDFGDGVYEWQVTFPEPGPYKILFNIPSLKIRWGDTSAQEITVIAKPSDDQATSGSIYLGNKRSAYK